MVLLVKPSVYHQYIYQCITVSSGLVISYISYINMLVGSKSVLVVLVCKHGLKTIGSRSYIIDMNFVGELS